MSTCQFSTERMDIGLTEATPGDAISILTPAVTVSLPLGWQDIDSEQKAKQWIADRKAESQLCSIAIDNEVVGFLILTGTETLHIGYLFKESSWGKGLATELIQGFVKWAKENNISKIVGGVEPTNIASIKSLEKNGFTKDTEHSGQSIMMQLIL